MSPRAGDVPSSLPPVTAAFRLGSGAAWSRAERAKTGRHFGIAPRNHSLSTMLLAPALAVSHFGPETGQTCLRTRASAGVRAKRRVHLKQSKRDSAECECALCLASCRCFLPCADWVRKRSLATEASASGGRATKQRRTRTYLIAGSRHCCYRWWSKEEGTARRRADHDCHEATEEGLRVVHRSHSGSRPGREKGARPRLD